ncbi:MAG: hypothetical protein DHS80DRAFT_33178 [Piptocephalis tieghemiana]|nr:MAG: hypothetical protein DHS80DRAFT_33178 [Piptocephalis tieghemiana]
MLSSADSKVNFIDVANPEDLDEALSTLPGGQWHPILFYADVESNTGKSWCDGCVKAHHPIQSTLEKNEKVSDVILCPVGVQSKWGDPQHHYRTLPGLQLSGVPALALWKKESNFGPILLESECHYPHRVEELLSLCAPKRR